MTDLDLLTKRLKEELPERCDDLSLWVDDGALSVVLRDKEEKLRGKEEKIPLDGLDIHDPNFIENFKAKMIDALTKKDICNALEATLKKDLELEDIDILIYRGHIVIIFSSEREGFGLVKVPSRDIRSPSFIDYCKAKIRDYQKQQHLRS